MAWVKRRMARIMAMLFKLAFVLFLFIFETLLYQFEAFCLINNSEGKKLQKKRGKSPPRKFIFLNCLMPLYSPSTFLFGTHPFHGNF